MNQNSQEQAENHADSQYNQLGNVKVFEQDDVKLQELIKSAAKDEQNLWRAILAGGLAALVGAIIWAIVTLILEWQIGFMAIGMGILVGNVVRWMGKGVDMKFGVTGAGLAALGCVAGNVLTTAIVISQLEEFGSLSSVLLTFVLLPRFAFELMIETGSPVDIIFYGIALYFGYKNALHQ